MVIQKNQKQGVTTINIDRTTIHTALGITFGSKSYSRNDRKRGIL